MSEGLPPPFPPEFPPPPGAPLAYFPQGPDARRRRPGVITAVGVASLVFAFVSAAGAVLTAIGAFLFYGGARAMSAAAFASQVMASANVAAVAPQPVVKATPEVGPNGIADPRRRGVVDAFYAVRPLRPPRVDQLDAILARHGQTILLSEEDRRAGLDVTPERVRGLVEDHGELFSRNRAAAPDYFRLTTGRLELYDDRAVFYPTDGSATLRNAFGRAAGRRALTDAEVAAVVKQAKALAPGAISDAQASALANVLAAADQKFIAIPASGAASALQAEPKVVTRGAGGAVSIRFGDGSLDLGPQGQVLTGPPGPAPAPRPSLAALLVVMAASVAGFALAVVLFIAAVLFLRGLPSGRRLHLTWAWIKLPVTVASAVAFWWMANSFYDALNRYDGSALSRFTGGPRTLMAEAWQPVAVAALGLIYPLAVLFVLRRQAVREYFNPAA